MYNFPRFSILAVPAILSLVGCPSHGGRESSFDDGLQNDGGASVDLADPGPLLPSDLISFMPLASIATGKLPFNLAVGDLNGDGKLDVATANSGGGSISVLISGGNGTLKSLGQVSCGGVGPWGLIISDIDKDGKSDIAVANPGSGSVGVLLGKGDGTFLSAKIMSIGRQPAGLASGDFDRDGNIDLAVADKSTNFLDILHGDGRGEFTLLKGYTVQGSSPMALMSASFSGRNWPDIMTLNYGSATLNLFRGNGDGSFSAPVEIPASKKPIGGAVADLDFDGKLDFVVSAETGTVGVMLGKGDGNFSEIVSYPAGISSQSVIAADLNGDRINDLAVANADSNSVSVFLGKGDGSFRSEKAFQIGGDAYGLGALDLNDDGRLDLVVSIGSTGIVRILNNTTPH